MHTHKHVNANRVTDIIDPRKLVSRIVHSHHGKRFTVTFSHLISRSSLPRFNAINHTIYIIDCNRKNYFKEKTISILINPANVSLIIIFILHKICTKHPLHFFDHPFIFNKLKTELKVIITLTLIYIRVPLLSLFFITFYSSLNLFQIILNRVLSCREFSRIRPSERPLLHKRSEH